MDFRDEIVARLTLKDAKDFTEKDRRILLDYIKDKLTIEEIKDLIKEEKERLKDKW